MELFKKTSYISGGSFPNSKKFCSEKNLLYFGKCNFLALSLKNFLFFKNFLEQAGKQKFHAFQDEFWSLVSFRFLHSNFLR